MVILDKTPQTTLLLACGTTWQPQCMHGAFSGAISDDIESIFQPLQQNVLKTVLPGHFCVSAASSYRLFSCGLPTDDWIHSPVGSNWDAILRTLIKTFKLTNWTKHPRNCLGESLHPFKIPPWRAHLPAVLQSHNWLWQKVARKSVSRLAWSQSLVFSQSISSPVCKTGLGSPGLLREFFAGCEWTHSCDIQLQRCNSGWTWTSYLGFNFHSSRAPEEQQGKWLSRKGHGNATVRAFCSFKSPANCFLISAIKWWVLLQT